MERATREVKKAQEVLKILRQGYLFPYFSAQDLAGFGEFTPQKVHQILERATKAGLLVRVSEGEGPMASSSAIASPILAYTNAETSAVCP